MFGLSLVPVNVRHVCHRESSDWFDSSLDADTALLLSDSVLRLVETFVIADNSSSSSSQSHETSADPFTRAEQ